MKKFITLPAILFLLAACATAPQQTAFANSRFYDMPFDEAWEGVISFFTANGIQIRTIEKASGLIYAEQALSDPAFADCGSGGLAIDIENLTSFNIFVREDGGRTSVTVNADFKIIREFDRRRITVQCLSTGTLERLILDSI